MSDAASETVVAGISNAKLVAAHISMLTSTEAAHFEYLHARSADVERCCPLDSTQHSAGFTLPSLNSLGALDMLPPEVNTQVLLYLNLSTITAFRQVNQCARAYIDSMYQYDDIVTHAPTVLRATLVTKSANWITLQNLHSTLTSTHKCSTCNDFGAFISLFTCTRTCYLCASRKTELHPLKPCEARIRYALDGPSSDALRRVKIIPGQYTAILPDPATNRPSKGKRYTLVDRSEAIRAGAKLHGSERRMRDVVAYRERRLQVKLRALDIKRSRRARRALGDVPGDSRSNNPRRFMSIIRAPWIDRQARVKADWGVFCKACSPCVTKDLYPIGIDKDPCLRCKGCEKCDYRHRDSATGCKGCLSGTKHRHSDGRRMFRREDYAAHFEDCERSKRVLRAKYSALDSKF